jgi:predicted secreted protein
LDGPFDPGKEFTVTATVANPVKGQTMTLELPEKLQLAQGDKQQAVPPADGSKVTWKVKVLAAGTFKVRVQSSTGVAQSKTLTIVQADQSAGRFSLRLGGAFDPGKEFTVTATVANPAKGQTLALELPDKLQVTQGDKQQTVPPADGSAVTWKVKVLEAGTFKVRVQSSTGVAQTKTLTIVQAAQSAGRFALKLDGSFDPGKEFTVTATVTHPVEGQMLTLELPEKLQRLEGDDQRLVPLLSPEKKDGTVTIAWRVRVLDVGTHRLRVVSSLGTAQAKTLVITRPKESGKEIFK